MSPAQKQRIRYGSGVSRFVHNETISYLQTPETKASWKGIKTRIIQGLPEWCQDAPVQIKSIAVKDACQTVKNAKKKYIDGGGISKCKFRTKKKPIQSCYIPKPTVKDAGIYHTVLGKLEYKEPLANGFGDGRLVSFYGD